jgi:probable F420-dependent oxidoreductase
LKKANFGLGIPTGTEGLMYPIPYSSAREVVDLSIYAEKLGFHSVWGNDHITTQRYVREEFEQPPRYYAPLITLTAIAERTERIKIATALLVIPFRNPLVTAKEIATLDQLSGGRLYLGVGLGAYREEFEAEFGDQAKKMVRGNMFDESMEIIYRLFTEENVTFRGEYFNIQNGQSFPRPAQNPFPFYFGGNSPNGYSRLVKWGAGWLPALLTPDEVKSGVAAIREICEKEGRNPNELEIAPQISVSIARTREEAIERYEKSQIYKHSCSLGKSTMKGKDPTNYTERNLVGSVDDVKEMVERYINAGVTTFSALIFADNTLDETRDHMRLFSEEIIKLYGK